MYGTVPPDVKENYPARGRSRDTIASRFWHRPDKSANILAPGDEQCRWLREIGYVDVDCFFCLFEFALFGGRKP